MSNPASLPPLPISSSSRLLVLPHPPPPASTSSRLLVLGPPLVSSSSRLLILPPPRPPASSSSRILVLPHPLVSGFTASPSALHINMCAVTRQPFWGLRGRSAQIDSLLGEVGGSDQSSPRWFEACPPSCSCIYLLPPPRPPASSSSRLLVLPLSTFRRPRSHSLASHQPPSPLAEGNGTRGRFTPGTYLY